MPYILKKDRDEIYAEGGLRKVDTAGKLNFTITKVLLNYIENKELSYQTINDIIGALEAAKLEFYRRLVVDYENLKKDVNGDVYNV